MSVDSILSQAGRSGFRSIVWTCGQSVLFAAILIAGAVATVLKLMHGPSVMSLEMFLFSATALVVGWILDARLRRRS